MPSAAVLATDCFDRFLAENGLLDFALASRDEQEIQRRFQLASLPHDVVQFLVAFLDGAHWPLAVRSSSLLEDSQYQPFTGVYDTFMLPNNQLSLAERLDQLMAAIKRVYASTFSNHAKAYLHATPYRLEEEKMAIVLQRVVGASHANRFYPEFSGVARSYNFYRPWRWGWGAPSSKASAACRSAPATRNTSRSSPRWRTRWPTRSGSSGRWS